LISDGSPDLTEFFSFTKSGLAMMIFGSVFEQSRSQSRAMLPVAAGD
jgi:hypothetical protein